MKVKFVQMLVNDEADRVIEAIAAQTVQALEAAGFKPAMVAVVDVKTIKEWDAAKHLMERTKANGLVSK